VKAVIHCWPSLTKTTADGVAGVKALRHFAAINKLFLVCVPADILHIQG